MLHYSSINDGITEALSMAISPNLLITHCLGQVTLNFGSEVDQTSGGVITTVLGFIYHDVRLPNSLPLIQS